MNNVRVSYSIIFFLILGAAGCSGSDIGRAYQDVANRVSKSSDTPDGNKIVGRFAGIEADKGSFLYFESNRLTVDAGQLESLSPATRQLLIKKLLLRKKIIQQGMEGDIYSSDEAARFILPRLEKILEDYYFFHVGNFPGIVKKMRQMTPDDILLNEMAKKGAGKGTGGKYDSQTLIREKNRILNTLARKRMMEKRKEIIGELLKNNPPMELY